MRAWLSWVPAFKRGNPNAAVSGGALGLHQLILQSELNNPGAATASAETPVGVEPVTGAYDSPGEDAVSAPERSSSEPHLGFLAGGAGVLGAVGLAGRALYRRRPRKCKTCGAQRTRLDESADDEHLDAGQRKEESVHASPHPLLQFLRPLQFLRQPEQLLLRRRSLLRRWLQRELVIPTRDAPLTPGGQGRRPAAKARGAAAR